MLDTIAANPAIARLRTELDPQVRAHPHRAHVIVYEIRDAEVLILRIRHSAEDWTSDPL